MHKFVFRLAPATMESTITSAYYINGLSFVFPFRIEEVGVKPGEGH